jgi:hypothetical protein
MSEDCTKDPKTGKCQSKGHLTVRNDKVEIVPWELGPYGHKIYNLQTELDAYELMRENCTKSFQCSYV